MKANRELILFSRIHFKVSDLDRTPISAYIIYNVQGGEVINRMLITWVVVSNDCPLYRLSGA